MTLPDIPRLYTALAEVLAVLVYAQAAPPRAAKPVTYAATAGWAAELGVFLQLTGSVPLAWWLPCMVAAIAWLYLYLWGTREMNLLEAGYSCARAFILAELAASVEWQLRCGSPPRRKFRRRGLPAHRGRSPRRGGRAAGAAPCNPVLPAPCGRRPA